MTSLSQKLSGIVGQAFEASELSADLGAVRVSDRPDLAQFQCNGAMAAAKVAKKNPREVAQVIVDVLSKNEIFSKIEIAGPGFINLNVTDEFLQEYLADIVQDNRFGIDAPDTAEEIIFDYGGPNIAKPMHVGHLRASIIGDTLRRIFSFVGYKTYGDIHLGDWGTHLGMLFSDYERDGKIDWILNLDLNNEADCDALFEDMSERYPKASAACKADETFMVEALRITKALQDKQDPYISVWEKVFQVSIAGMKKNFAALNVHFDLWQGEASVQDLIEPMVEKLRADDFTEMSNGATIIDVTHPDDKKEMPPLLLLKTDGAAMYGTTDLATIVDRVEKFDLARMVYVVDQRQALHFEQVFRAAYKAKLVPENVEMTHAGFGTMNGTDGKPFKTRAGGVMKLEDLITMGVEKAQMRLKEANLASDIDEVERGEIAKKVAIAAIKFADLQNQRTSNYVFDLDRLTSFEGKTGPYLLYQAVRIKSLLRKAGEFDESAPLIIQDADRALALMLTELPDALNLTMRTYAPHHLCEHVYKLSQAFSSFYGNCHILSEENEALRNSRLKLSQISVTQIELILSLLGIDVPERM